MAISNFCIVNLISNHKLCKVDVNAFIAFVHFSSPLVKIVGIVAWEVGRGQNPPIFGRLSLSLCKYNVITTKRLERMSSSEFDI